MKRRLSRALAVGALVAATSVGLGHASPAAADPGHCWRQGFGPIAATPGWAYELKNVCSRTINVRVVLQNGQKSSCKAISAYGHRSYFLMYYSSYFWGENC